MNSNSYDFPIPSGSRSNGLKSGTSGVCFAHRFYPGIARRPGFKAPDRRLELLHQPLWHGIGVRAGAVPSQTASPESVRLRYFPL